MRSFLRTVIYMALLFRVVASHETTNNSSTTLKRQRLDDRDLAASSLAMAAVDAVTESLEEIWARETALAQKEIGRLLQRLAGSLSPTTRAPAGSSPAAAPARLPVAAPVAGPIPAGDCLQGRTPEQFLLDELLLITGVNLLLDPASPQGQAFTFILSDSLIRQDVCVYPAIAQRYGLGTIE